MTDPVTHPTETSDSLPTAIQLVLIGVSVGIWRSLRLAPGVSSRAHVGLRRAKPRGA